MVEIRVLKGLTAILKAENTASRLRTFLPVKL
jgi:hypothetical protein